MIDSIERAFAFNPELKATQESRQMTQYAVQRAEAGHSPTVGAYAGAGVIQASNLGTRAQGEGRDYRAMGDVSLRLVQPLWHGGAISKEQEARKAQLEAADFSLYDKGAALAFDALAAHINVLRRQELVRLAKNNVAKHTEILRTTRLRYETNIATAGELHQIEGRLARAKAVLLSYESSLDAAQVMYTRITGISAAGKTLVPAILPNKIYPSVQAGLDACLANNKKIKAALAEVKAAQAEKGIAKSSYYPQFDLEAGPSWSDQDNKSTSWGQSVDATVRMRWDLFNGGKDLATVSMSSAKVRLAKQTLQALMNSLREDIGATHSAFLSAQGQAIEYEQAKKASMLTREDYYRQFLAAQRSLIDVLDAENDYFYAASQHVLAQTDRVIAGYRLLALGGELLQELHINPGALHPKGPTTSEQIGNFGFGDITNAP